MQSKPGLQSRQVNRADNVVEKNGRMIDYHELMKLLSTPRPAGSRAAERVREGLLACCKRHQLPHRLHSFRLYPYFFVAIGLWLVLSRLLLAVAVWLRWGWAVLAIALIGLVGGLVDYLFDVPLVSWIGAKQSQNILIEIEPHQAHRARQEMVISAHYDSKTELLDHRQRMLFVKNMSLGILLTALLGLLGPVEQQLKGSAANFVYGASVALSIPVLFLTWGMGLNLALGRLRKHPSQGAVDNGAACAILLGLAHDLQHSGIALKNTRLVLALFDGEEVSMQGSRAYTRGRDWPLPVIALNLEVMAQNGEYVYWEQDGTSMQLTSTASEVNQRICAAVAEVAGKPALPGGPINSDGFSFLRMGIPTAVLGTYDKTLQDRGFHQPSDNLGRVVMERLPEGVEILKKFILTYDQEVGDNEI